MTRKQDSAKARITAEDLKQLLAEDRDLLKVIGRDAAAGFGSGDG